MGSFRYHSANGRINYDYSNPYPMSFQEQNERAGKGHGKRSQEYCNGAFDIYFILDRSDNMKSWPDLYTCVKHIAGKYVNPKLRMSFITFSTKAEVNIWLTSNRESIRDQLTLLEDIEPHGETNLQKGIRKANEQIRQAMSDDIKVSSVIIIFLSGKLMPETFKETQEELAKAQRMGAYIYFVSANVNNREQVEALVDSPDHRFALGNGPAERYGLVDLIGTKACLEVRSVEPSTVCLGESKQVVIHGYGFNNAKEKDQVICRFKFRNTKVIDQRPIGMGENSIICPAPNIESHEEQVFVEASLNDGKNFLSNDLSIKSTGCSAGPQRSASLVQDDDDDDFISGSRRKSILPIPGLPIPGIPGLPIPGLGGDPEPAGPLEGLTSNPLFLPLLLLALLGLLLLICGIWYLCRRKKKSGQRAEKVELACVPLATQPVTPCPPQPAVCPAPTVVVSCCENQGVCRLCRTRMRKDNLGTMCGFAQPSCNQVSPMWCPRRFQGRCLNLPLMQPPCAPCGPKFCLRYNQDCLPMTQAPCVSKVCLPHSWDCLPMTQAPCMSRCQQLPASCSRPSSRMLQLSPPPAQCLRRMPMSLPPL
nr:anthrax toxin receptor-like isoform X2 [Microcebus murinus]